MILTCPACATQYRLKDGAIPPEGRQVRCAACKHKWHQDGDAAAEPAATGDAAHDHDAPAAAIDQAVGIAPPQPDPHVAAPTVATIPEAAARDAMIGSYFLGAAAASAGVSRGRCAALTASTTSR